MTFDSSPLDASPESSPSRVVHVSRSAPLTAAWIPVSLQKHESLGDCSSKSELRHMQESESMNTNSIDANLSKISSCYVMKETKQNKNLILIHYMLVWFFVCSKSSRKIFKTYSRFEDKLNMFHNLKYQKKCQGYTDESNLKLTGFKRLFDDRRFKSVNKKYLGKSWSRCTVYKIQFNLLCIYKTKKNMNLKPL